MPLEDELQKIEDAHREAQEEDQIDPEQEARLSKLIRAEKNSALGFLVAGIVHDSRTFITPIIGSAEMGLKLAEKSGAEELANYFSMIQESAERLNNMINNLLDFSKRSRYTRSTVYINNILETVVEIYRSQYVHARVNLEVDFQEVPKIAGYPAGIESVFSNMLTNALQAYEDIPKERPKTVNVRSYHKEGYIFIEFEDDGCGIKKKELPKIFTIGYSTKGEKGGHGLGLATSLMIVKQSHFGKIFVESECGKGTKFTIRIPDTQTLKDMREETLCFK